MKQCANASNELASAEKALSVAALCAGDYRTAVDLVAFLGAFLQRFPQYEGRPFWITGESYGTSAAGFSCNFTLNILLS